MFINLLRWVKQAINMGVQVVQNQLTSRTKPTTISLVCGSLHDLVRTKPQLIAENALLRQQLIVLNRGVKRPRLAASDRSLLVLLASRVQAGCPRIMALFVGSWVVERSRVPFAALTASQRLNPHRPGPRLGRTVSSGLDHVSRGWTARPMESATPPTVNRFTGEGVWPTC